MVDEVSLANDANLKDLDEETAALLRRMKDDLLIVLLVRVADEKGEVIIPCDEVDNVPRGKLLSMSADSNRNFVFKVSATH